MNHHEIRRRLNRCEVTAAAVNTRLGPVLTNMRDAMVGHPRSGGYEPTGRSGVSDPTGRDGIRFDEAQAARRELERLVTIAADALAAAARIASNYLPLSSRQAAELSRLASANAEPGCQSCARVGVWSPVHVNSSDVGGRLDALKSLCRPCWRFVGVNDRLPSRAEMELWRDTGKLRPLESAGR
ncbi:MAG TPA: hypothetical protein VFJ14_01715 [Nocardioidaceae bacterium]|nr:hypothetical protein [Nocardioidaceae bacterium]